MAFFLDHQFSDDTTRRRGIAAGTGTGVSVRGAG